MSKNAHVKMKTLLFVGLAIFMSLSVGLLAGKNNGKGGGPNKGGSDPALENQSVNVVVRSLLGGPANGGDAVVGDESACQLNVSNSYCDGAEGVYAIMNNSSCADPTSPACGDFLFDADRDYSRRDEKRGVPRRTISIILDSPTDGDSNKVISTEILLGDESPFMNVDHVFTSDPIRKAAIFNTLIGQLKFDADVTFVSGLHGTCGWWISSDSLNVASLWSYDQQPQVIGTYYFPFEMEVSLQDGSLCYLLP